MSELKVIIDPRVRIVSAILAAGEWPEREQATKPHAIHQHARQTIQYASAYQDHEAVTHTNTLLKEGITVDTLYSMALRCSWPTFEPTASLPEPFTDEEWVELLMDFYTDSAIAAFFWADHEKVWDSAVAQLEQICLPAGIPQFIAKLASQPLTKQFTVMPNLMFPALDPVLASSDTEMALILPPPQAWGESHPWEYKEGVDWVLAECGQKFAAAALADSLQALDADQRKLALFAITACFLEEAQDKATSLSYIVRARKEKGLPELADATEKLQGWLVEPAGAWHTLFQ